MMHRCMLVFLAKHAYVDYSNTLSSTARNIFEALHFLVISLFCKCACSVPEGSAFSSNSMCHLLRLELEILPIEIFPL